MLGQRQKNARLSCTAKRNMNDGCDRGADTSYRRKDANLLASLDGYEHCPINVVANHWKASDRQYSSRFCESSETSLTLIPFQQNAFELGGLYAASRSSSYEELSLLLSRSVRGGQFSSFRYRFRILLRPISCPEFVRLETGTSAGIPVRTRGIHSEASRHRRSPRTVTGG